MADAYPAGSSADAISAPSTDTFTVHLEVFEGPFDLLLTLITRQKLDLTAVALSRVTDDFLAFLRSDDERRRQRQSLDRASRFLVVAASLLEMKAARLLPAPEVDDEEDLAALEARDLLFARLLQYRAFRDAAAFLAERVAVHGRRYPRQAALDAGLASLLPEVVIGVGPEELAELAVSLLRAPPEPEISLEHLHVAPVSAEDAMAAVVERLARSGQTTFRALRADCLALAEVVARFLALLELYRDGLVTFDQLAPLAELVVRWLGVASASVDESGS